MIQYTYLRNNLLWEGVYNELRHFIQMWRKELGLSLNDPVSLKFTVGPNDVVKAFLTVPGTCADCKDIELNKHSLAPIIPNTSWNVLAAGCEYIGSKALLNCVRITNEMTSEEVFWSR